MEHPCQVAINEKIGKVTKTMINFLEPYFKRVPGVGDLHLEEVLLEDNCALLFVLTDKNESDPRKFITICRTNLNKQKWIAYEINDQILEEMKHGTLSLKQGIKTFPAGTSVVVEWDKHTDTTCCKVFVGVAHDIDSLDDNIMINESDEEDVE